MKKALFGVLFLLGGLISSFTQNPAGISLFLQSVIQNPEQEAYFMENFKNEIAGAGYILADSVNEADYILLLDVLPNKNLYQMPDGTVFERPVSPNEKQFMFNISIFRSNNYTEVVSYSQAFTQTEEMFEHNFNLLHEVMANVPLPGYGYTGSGFWSKRSPDDERIIAFGLGFEVNMNTRSNFAGGGVFTFDINFAKRMAAGIGFIASHDFKYDFVFEPSVMLRHYFGKGHKGIFLQMDLGAYIVYEDGKMETTVKPIIEDLPFTPMGGLKTGYRFPQGALYIEPYGRVGYPFVFGIGVMAGMDFIRKKNI